MFCIVFSVAFLFGLFFRVLRPEHERWLCPADVCCLNVAAATWGHLQHCLALFVVAVGFPPFLFFCLVVFFYAFYFHVQFRIWRTLSLKDCTWKFYGRCSSFWGPALRRSRVRPGLVSYCQLAGWVADWHYVAFFLMINFMMTLVALCLAGCSRATYATRLPMAPAHRLLKWNVKCNPAAAKCHVYLPAPELASEPAKHSVSPAHHSTASWPQPSAFRGPMCQLSLICWMPFDRFQN